MDTVARTVILDVETTGLDVDKHHITEVAWHILQTGEEGHLIPTHTLANADPITLQISQYETRISGVPFATTEQIEKLWRILGGDGITTTLAGINPKFASDFLQKMFTQQNLKPKNPWTYRLLDIASMAYALYPLPVGSVPGLAELANICQVPSHVRHNAKFDVQTLVECYKKMELLKYHNTHNPYPLNVVHSYPA